MQQHSLVTRKLCGFIRCVVWKSFVMFSNKVDLMLVRKGFTDSLLFIFRCSSMLYLLVR